MCVCEHVHAHNVVCRIIWLKLHISVVNWENKPTKRISKALLLKFPPRHIYYYYYSQNSLWFKTGKAVSSRIELFSSPHLLMYFLVLQEHLGDYNRKPRKKKSRSFIIAKPIVLGLRRSKSNWGEMYWLEF